jgi:Domain of Unknown Function (DUF1080)/FKBP-type peptidyl-prolyl cis-trans isomerase
MKCRQLVASAGRSEVRNQDVRACRKLIVIAPILIAGMSSGVFAAKANHAGFVRLYNGRDLDGWTTTPGGKMSAWKADGDLLSCVGPGGGWLHTSKMYSDFILRVEYRIPRGGNSGVGLRFPPTGDPAHQGMEIQILDDSAPEYADIKPAQHTGSVYYQSAAKQGVAKPAGQWNAYEITCLGPHVKVVLNGQVVSDVMVDEYTKGEGGHKPLSERPEVGYVGLQSHAFHSVDGSRIDFRNIEIKDLTTQTPSGVHYVDLKEGTGPVVPAGATIAFRYTGRFTDGTKFDSNRNAPEPLTRPLTRLIKGWQEGIPGMKVGGRRKLVIPPELAYGNKQKSVIPPNSTLVFDIEVVKLVAE